MKKNLFYFMMLFVALGFMVSCDDDDDPEVIDNPVYGMQVIGTATDGKALVIDKSQMVEPSSSWEVKSVREGMYYGIYYLTAGELSFKEVTATSEVIYGISEVAETTQTAEAENAFTFSRGNLVVDGTETFNIASEGLYYIMTDKTSETFWVMKINSFLISTIEDEATMVSGSAAGAVYEILGADVRGEFKVKINSAWKIIADDILYGGTEYPEDGIRPIISFGGALNALTFDGSEIPFTPIAGHLTDFTFNWDPSKKGIAGITITTADAGEKVPTDYSDYLLGFIGNAVTVADTSWGWGNESYENKLPTKAKGISYRELEEMGVMLPVKELAIEYFNPVSYDEEVIIDVRIENFTRIKVKFSYDFSNKEGIIFGKSTSINVFTDKDGKIKRLNEEIFDKIKGESNGSN